MASGVARMVVVAAAAWIGIERPAAAEAVDVMVIQWTSRSCVGKHQKYFLMQQARCCSGEHGTTRIVVELVYPVPTRDEKAPAAKVSAGEIEVVVTAKPPYQGIPDKHKELIEQLRAAGAESVTRLNQLVADAAPIRGSLGKAAAAKALAQRLPGFTDLESETRALLTTGTSGPDYEKRYHRALYDLLVFGPLKWSARELDFLDQLDGSFPIPPGERECHDVAKGHALAPDAVVVLGVTKAPPEATANGITVVPPCIRGGTLTIRFERPFVHMAMGTISATSLAEPPSRGPDVAAKFDLEIGGEFPTGSLTIDAPSKKAGRGPYKFYLWEKKNGALAVVKESGAFDCQ
jgi:hypothetical protein